MTSDLETTTDDLYNTIRELFQEAQGTTGDDLPSSGFGQKVASVTDAAIASATGLELTAVQEYLDNANGVQLVVERDGESRRVTGLL
jgi:outer membrane lipoprotein SlyB